MTMSEPQCGTDDVKKLEAWSNGSDWDVDNVQYMFRKVCSGVLAM